MKLGDYKFPLYHKKIHFQLFAELFGACAGIRTEYLASASTVATTSSRPQPSQVSEPARIKYNLNQALTWSNECIC